jgi:ligand-binding SRPBCC domain-containing protein
VKLHTLSQTQTIPIPLEEAWEFFATPQNLDRLTPDDMPFRIISGADEGMFAGQLITYKIKVLSLVWVDWVTEITAVQSEGDQRYFIDEQRFGPNRFWHHLHRYESTEEGHTRMVDRVNYALPFGVLGEIPHALFVKRQMEAVFEYRRKTVEEIFGSV